MRNKNVDNLFLDSAISIAKFGTCKKRNYGCVIAYDGKYVSAGHTFSEKKCTKCSRLKSEPGHDYDKCPSIHAEQMAIISTKIPKGATAYLACIDPKTMLEVMNPRCCPTCLKLLKYVGIKTVVTRTEVIELEDK